jgi:DNA-binding MarR family transcriptional regulator
MNESAMNQPAETGCDPWRGTALAGKLAPAVLVLGRLLGRRLERALSESGLGITPAQARVLLKLHIHGPLTQQALALQTEVDPSTLVSTLDVMEREGMAVRDPNPGDRRAHLVRLTPEGERRIPRLFELWDSVEAEWTRDMSAADRETFLKLVQELVSRLQEGDATCD